MSDLYIQESGLKLSIFDEKIIVRTSECEIIKEIALAKISNVLVFGQAQLTTQLLKKLAQQGINVYYFTRQGKFLSYLESANRGDYEKQYQQAKMVTDSQFSLSVAKKIAVAKVRNQTNLLRAYDSDGLLDQSDYDRFLTNVEGIEEAKSIQEIMGFEGRQAKSYFYYLNLLVPENFHFYGRSRRPAVDKFNSMLNYGYGVLYSFFIGMVKKHGLSPGFAVIHRPHGSHATLASDLMEEWRPVIVDDTVMKLLIGGVITEEMFEDIPDKGITMTTEARKLMAQELQERMLEIHDYIECDKKRYTFPYMVDMQILSLIRSFKEEDPELYLIGSTDERG